MDLSNEQLAQLGVRMLEIVCPVGKSFVDIVRQAPSRSVGARRWQRVLSFGHCSESRRGNGGSRELRPRHACPLRQATHA
jgi:hypothetical protein